MDVFKERMEAAFQSSCLGNEPLVNGDIKEGINLNFLWHLPISQDVPLLREVGSELGFIFVTLVHKEYITCCFKLDTDFSKNLWSHQYYKAFFKNDAEREKKKKEKFRKIAEPVVKKVVAAIEHNEYIRFDIDRKSESYLVIYSSDKLSEELRELLNDSNNIYLFNGAFSEGIQKQGYLKGKYCYDPFDFGDFIFEIRVKVNENGEIEKVFY